MKAMALLAAVCAFTFLAAPASAADKKNQELIVGKWAPADDKEKGVTIEFTKTGDLKVSVKNEAVNLSLDGKYKFLDDKTVEVTLQLPGTDEKKSEKLTIKSISADEMVVDNKGKEEKMKRLK